MTSRRRLRDGGARRGGFAGERRGGARRLVIAASVALAAVLMYFVVCIVQVWSTGRSVEARPADAIVVMGAAQYDGRPSPQLAARLDEVLRLWPQGFAPLVVATGGRQPGDRFTEAEASARYLVDRGVPESAILLDNEGTTTYESLEATATMLAGRGLNRVLIVTDPFHALRSKLIARELGLRADVVPTTSSVAPGSPMRVLREAAGVALGRVIGFERLDRLVG